MIRFAKRRNRKQVFPRRITSDGTALLPFFPDRVTVDAFGALF